MIAAIMIGIAIMTGGGAAGRGSGSSSDPPAAPNADFPGSPQYAGPPGDQGQPAAQPLNPAAVAWIPTTPSLYYGYSMLQWCTWISAWDALAWARWCSRSSSFTTAEWLTYFQGEGWKTPIQWAARWLSGWADEVE